MDGVTVSISLILLHLIRIQGLCFQHSFRFNRIETILSKQHKPFAINLSIHGMFEKSISFHFKNVNRPEITVSLPIVFN